MLYRDIHSMKSSEQAGLQAKDGILARSTLVSRHAAPRRDGHTLPEIYQHSRPSFSIGAFLSRVHPPLDVLQRWCAQLLDFLALLEDPAEHLHVTSRLSLCCGESSMVKLLSHKRAIIKVEKRSSQANESKTLTKSGEERCMDGCAGA
jgi:hypothetical protein